MGLFDSQAENTIRATLRAQKEQAKARQHDQFELAIDYLENRQLEDTRGELSKRYPTTQAATDGSEIRPLTIPLTERYVAEAANAYNRPVERELVTEDGKVDEEETKRLNDHLGEIGYNEILHRLEQILVLVHTCGLWFGIKRGMLKPRIVVPHKIHPVVPQESRFMDPTDPDDYFGFALELINDAEDTSSATERQFVLLTPTEHIYYSGTEWKEWNGQLDRFPNPFKWPQVDQSGDSTPTEMFEAAPPTKDLPLQMLTFWHNRLPFDDQLIGDTDPEVVILNRELNVEWSALMHVIRMQGHGQLVANLLNPDSMPGIKTLGASYMVPVSTTEDLKYINSTVNYTGIVTALKTLVQLMAVAKRQSPNDFSLEGRNVSSGFAKVIDSLPKMEARDERLVRLMFGERRAWPRMGSSLHHAKVLKRDPRSLRLRVEFEKIKPPLTIDEDNAQNEFNFKHHLDSPVRLLSRRRGITIEEAEELVAKHKEENESPAAEPGQGGAPLGGGLSLFGNLARQPRGPASA